jgi:hypothetical protein
MPGVRKRKQRNTFGKTWNFAYFITTFYSYFILTFHVFPKVLPRKLSPIKISNISLLCFDEILSKFIGKD